MARIVLANRWLRRVAVSLIALAALAVAGRAYRAYKGYVLLHTIANTVSKVRANVIEPNGLTVNEPFGVGLKPEWWYDQWLITPTATPAKKVVVVRIYLKSSWLGHDVKRIEIGCMFHDPGVGKELEPYGVEDRHTEVRVKDIPPAVLLGDRRVDLRRWFPGSFEEAGEPRRPGGRPGPDAGDETETTMKGMGMSQPRDQSP